MLHPHRDIQSLWHAKRNKSNDAADFKFARNITTSRHNITTTSRNMSSVPSARNIMTSHNIMTLRVSLVLQPIILAA